MRILMVIFCFVLAGCATGTKPLMENKAQVAETMNLKLADTLNGIKQDFNGKLTGIEKVVSDFTAKADAQLAGIAGVNNSISKVATDLKMGNIGGSFNDTELMKQYVKYLAFTCGALILTNFLTFLFVIIGLIATIIYTLKSDRLNDSRRDRVFEGTKRVTETAVTTETGKVSEVAKPKKEAHNA